MFYSLICITYLTPPFLLLHAILETALTHLRGKPTQAVRHTCSGNLEIF